MSLCNEHRWKTNLTNSHNFQLTKTIHLKNTKVFCFLHKKRSLCRNNMVGSFWIKHPSNIMICNLLTIFNVSKECNHLLINHNDCTVLLIIIILIFTLILFFFFFKSNKFFLRDLFLAIETLTTLPWLKIISWFQIFHHPRALYSSTFSVTITFSCTIFYKCLSSSFLIKHAIFHNTQRQHTI